MQLARQTEIPLKALTLEALINLSTCRLMPIVINFKKKQIKTQ